MAVRPLAFLTSYLRAYRVGTGGMLLHMVLEGEQTTIFRQSPKNRPKLTTHRRRKGSLANSSNPDSRLNTRFKLMTDNSMVAGRSTSQKAGLFLGPSLLLLMMLTVPRMARAGLVLNLIGIVLVSAVAYKLAPIVLN